MNPDTLAAIVIGALGLLGVFVLMPRDPKADQEIEELDKWLDEHPE